MILGENGEKMSKSRGNVVNPDDIVRAYGADTMRLYEMFIGDFEKAAPWSSSSIKGCKRFLERTFDLSQKILPGDGCRPVLESSLHKAIKKVGEDIVQLKMNTAIATLMSLINEIDNAGGVTKDEFRIFLLLLNPFAPHITEELWQMAGFEGQIAHAAWPVYDEAKCRDAEVEIAVQVCGKVRGRVVIAADLDGASAIAAAKQAAGIPEQLAGKTVVKEIYVPGKLVNIVVK